MPLGPKAPLIITGMHRSGTSLLARFIHNSGIDLGDKMLDALSTNPYGHFEDVEILEFHREILTREFGHTMWVPSAAPTRAVDKEKARGLLRQRQSKHKWGWKEPRTSLFLDFWNELLPEANYLFVIRHPALVLESLARRVNSNWYRFWKHNRFLRAWLVYNQACYDFYRKHDERTMLIILEEVLKAPDKVTALLSFRLEVDFSVDDFHAAYDPKALKQKRSRQWIIWPPLYRQAVSLFKRMKSDADI